MIVFRVDHDTNRFRGFRDPRRDLFDSIYGELRAGRAIGELWRPGPVDVTSGRKGDFVGGPTIFARIAITKRAHAPIASYLGAFAEFLPFEYDREVYWAIYLPRAYECLDYGSSEFWGNSRNPSQIKKVVFDKSKIPGDPLFRIKDTFDYYGKEEFKELVEEHGLTGLSFREVWRDETGQRGEEVVAAQGAAITLPKKRSQPEPANRDAYAGKSGRINKRERLLLRLWREVINHRGTAKWLQEELNAQDQEDEDFPFLSDASRVLKKAAAAGLSGEDLRRLARGIAYQVVFDAAVAIDEERALKAPYAGLHEDLLMAGSDPSADVAEAE